MATEGVHIVFYKTLKWKVWKPDEKGKIQEKIQSTQVVLLYKRTQDAPIHPGYWALFGGKKDEKDKDEKTVLIREIIKEHELQVDCLSCNEYKTLLLRANLLINVELIKHNGKKLIKYYKAKLDYDMDSLRLGQHPKEYKIEGEGLGWFTEEETTHLWLRPEDRIALSQFFHPRKTRAVKLRQQG